ncbi:hypothetical protein JCM33374_g3994 [Metschnikowia sp. JCM 33374]|nr:hypothetical protein JCM33374_g3994 [Metschnikowia sp. JCM 33374]
MSCPRRTLISEPFACQIEAIEKATIEVQNQPLPYYSRRQNPTAPSAGTGVRHSVGSVSGPNATGAGGLALGQTSHAHAHPIPPTQGPGHNHATSSLATNGANHGPTHAGAHGQPTKAGHGMSNFPHNNKYPYFSQQQQQQQQQPLDLYTNNYRVNGVLGSRGGSNVNPSQSTSALGSVTGDLGSVPGLHSSMGPVSMTPHIPQVFKDDTMFPVGTGLMSNPGDSPVLMDAKKIDGLSTFDPFGTELSGYSGQGSLFSPIFNSSSNILGSTYNSPSSNIWGNTGKRMAGDAAVWG